MSVHRDSYRLKNRKTEPPAFILRVKRVFCSMGDKDLVDLGKLEQLFLTMTINRISSQLIRNAADGGDGVIPPYTEKYHKPQTSCH